MFERYAIYHCFNPRLRARGAEWLGWDMVSGTAITQPSHAGIDLGAVTARARRYGFHATIKAPFRLATQRSERGLKEAFAAACSAHPAAQSEGLQLSRIGRFLALTLRGDDSAVKTLARGIVQELDPFRAPLSTQEIQRRNPARLSKEQHANLMNWGYPHVLEAFQFHATLTGPLNKANAAPVWDLAEQTFAPVLPAPFALGHLSLVGQKSDGYFYEIQRAPLEGT